MYFLKPLQLQLLRRPLRATLRSISDKPVENPKFHPLAGDELSRVIYTVLWQASKCNQRKRGVHEAIKSLYFRTSEFIVMAADTDPSAILDPLISLAKDMKVPYVFVPLKAELGAACKASGAVAACSVITSHTSPIYDEIELIKEAIINL